jgi:DNA-binding GntR family transcriptional regulator
VEAEHVTQWCELNGEFHEVLIAEAGNQTLAKFVQQVDSVPLAAARTIAPRSTTSIASVR